MFVIRLKTANACDAPRFAHFNGFPNWTDLSSTVTEMFSIPQQEVHFAYVEKTRGLATLRSDKDLQYFYQSLESSEQIKLVVQDLRSPDPASRILSSWSGSSISDQDNKVTLRCWVFNLHGGAFSVDIQKDAIVDKLKEIIKTKMKNALAGIDYNILKIWKLNPPIPDHELAVKLESLGNPGDIPGCSNLSPFVTIGDHFSSGPSDHIHLIVQLPECPLPSGEKTRKVALPSQVLEIVELESKIQQALALIRVEIETFLQNPELPQWDPPSFITDPSVLDFLRNLRLPAYPNGSPSLLYHNLYSNDDEVIKRTFGQGKHLFICNTSGSGKTRLILEGLSQYWGFYFVSAVDQNFVGVRDLQVALGNVGRSEEWTDDLTHIEGPKRGEANRCNIRISNKAIRKVLAARVLVFKLFLELVQARDGQLLEDHKRIWLQFQLSSTLPGFQTLHPFIRMMNCLDLASDRALTTIIQGFEDIHSQYFPHSKFVIALDEAQQAARLYRFSFLSSGDSNKFRSILREIVKVFSELEVKIAVAGTKLSLEEVEDAPTSGVGKSPGQFQTFVELGMLNDPEATMQRYIPPSILNSMSGKSLQLRIREYLPGRYRFLNSFLEFFLMNGLQSPHTLLNKYLEEYIGSPPGDLYYTRPFSSVEPPLQIQPRIGTFDWQGLRENLSDAQEVAAIVQAHVIKRSTPAFGPLRHKHVEYGIAHLRKDHQSEIVEPLAFLSIVRWLETQEDLCLKTNLRREVAYQDFRGFAFEGIVILFLLRTFCRPTALNSVFKFHGTVPAWADMETHIIGRLQDVPVDLFDFSPRYPSLSVVYYAETIEDIVQWLQESPSSSVLVPTNLFGPDMIIKCHGLLLMGHTNSYLTGNTAATTAKALKSLNPMSWFIKESYERRLMLVQALQEYPILRFLAGYPLSPDLDSTADSVQNALSDLGEQPLAILPMDMFRALFILPSEVRNVLEPMEHALSRKRKLDMMD